MNKTIKRALLLLTFLGTLAVSYLMWTANQNDQLWGYYPMFLYIFGWAFFVLLLEKRFSKFPRRLERLGLATLSGIILALGFPVSPLTPLMFIGFVPLLMVENEIFQFREEPSKWEVYKYAYHAFVVWNMLTTYWVNNTAFIAGFLAIFLNSMFMAIPFMLFHQSKKVLGLKFAFPAFVAFWLTFEYLHLRQELSWPWLTLGNSFAQYPSWIQWYEYTGVFGGSLWILLANFLLYKIAQQFFVAKDGFNKMGLVKVSALILLPIIISVVWYFNYEERGEQVEVVVVQPNFEPHHEKFRIGGKETIEKCIALAEKAVTENTEYVVLPETVIGRIDVRKPGEMVRVRDLARFVDQYPKLKLITGFSAFKILKPGEEHTKFTRTQVRKGRDTMFWESYNIAAQVKSGSAEVPIYYKSVLVPGAEFTPYRKIFWWAEPIVDKLGGSLAGFGSQPERSVFSGDGKAVGPVICYESVYGEYCTDYVRKGADALFIVTNDGWWDNTAGHKQHLKFSSLRAIETRRAIARSANTGISGFISQRGEIYNTSIYGEDDAINDTIYFNKSRTFYTKWGDLIGRIALFLAALFLVNTIAKSWMKKVGKQ